jgi:tetratricopeptide (TPR) repeat protein
MKISEFRALVLLLSLSLSFSPLFADDKELQKALAAANAGRQQEAIVILERLQVSTPNDERVLASLGFLYKSTRHYAEAISTLEKAAGIKATPEVLYELGLLYEGKSFHSTDPSTKGEYRQKALETWNRFLTVAQGGDEHTAKAQEHIKKLSDPLQ